MPDPKEILFDDTLENENIFFENINDYDKYIDQTENMKE